jgi:hypothetical protein
MDTKRIFIILSLVFVIAIALVSMGIACVGGVKGIGLLGVLFFVTFGIIVILAQLIPAAILLSSFVETTFSFFRKSELPVRAV